MHSNITKLEARKLMNKIDSSSVPIGLFANGCGSYVTVKTGTESFDRRVRQHPDTLIGVFNIYVTVSQLEDELAAVNVK